MEEEITNSLADLIREKKGLERDKKQTDIIMEAYKQNLINKLPKDKKNITNREPKGSEKDEE